MKRNAVLTLSLLTGALALNGCGGATETVKTNATNSANANANAAIVVNPTNSQPVAATNQADPTLNATPQPAPSGAIPGIPGSTANDVKQIQNDPTRNSKVQKVTRPAPDDSEIETSLADTIVDTRIFKKHPQIAKVEVALDMNRKPTKAKVYLKNGQVRELDLSKVADPLSESGDNILRAMGGNVPKTEAAPNNTAADVVNPQAESKSPMQKKNQ